MVYTVVDGFMSAPAHLEVLFVDDDPSVRYVAGQMLARLGHSVTLASEGQEALALFGERHDSIDLAIVDDRMTDMSGLEVGLRLRQMASGFPVILYGGNIDPSVGDAAESAGIAVCQKPASREELRSAIEEAFGHRGGSPRSNTASSRKKTPDLKRPR